MLPVALLKCTNKNKTAKTTTIRKYYSSLTSSQTLIADTCNILVLNYFRPSCNHTHVKVSQVSLKCYRPSDHRTGIPTKLSLEVGLTDTSRLRRRATYILS